MIDVRPATGPTSIELADGRPADLTTVDDTSAVVHVTQPDGGVETIVVDGLEPDTDHELAVADTTIRVRTLPTPAGELRCTFTTVNDVHFGEVVAGLIEGFDGGPLRSAEPGAEPYPEVMNRSAVTDMRRIEPTAVIVKGDLSVDGTDEEWAAFERCYRDSFGDTLHVVRGNHDAYRHQTSYAGDAVVDLPGIRLAVIDTTIPGSTTGMITDDQATWLRDVGDHDGAVLVLGHHQQWVGQASDPSDPGSQRRSDDYFGIHPDGSDRLDAVCVDRPSIIGYTAGHTHRHRRREMTASGRPTVEIGCTKDFPGTWAEYRVYDGGVMQVVHRISAPEALRWSESCRHLYADVGVDYAAYALGELSDRCFVVTIDE
ncbi:MAG: metallophosphoesterase [Actinomycetota bacterium]